jgi:hypothetical protein
VKTLFPPINWVAFIAIAFILEVFFPQTSLLCYIALILSLYQFILLFNAIGSIIPVRYLFGAFMCLQFFIGPSLAYNGFDEYQYWLYRMQIPESAYFSYAIPAVLSFIIGLHITAGNFKGEIIDEAGVARFADRNPRLAYIFIGIGFFASIVSGYISSELAFVFYVLGSLKFIGLFLIALGNKKLKLAPLILVMGSIIASSLSDAMFHDLLTWLLFVGAVYALKYKFGFNLKLGACVSFILLAVIIQQLKGSYRDATGTEGKQAGLETFSEIYEAQNQGSKSIFSFASLAPSVVRINQGFIITNIMKRVPDVEPFSNGEEMNQILEAAFLPRVLAPNKLQAGDRVLFERYSGIHLREGTSMGLGSLGDAYLNYGIIGGSIFMFVLGLSYSFMLNYFDKQSKKNQPILLLFIPLIVYYPIRPDCELQTIMGHFVKTTFMVLAAAYFWKSAFYDQPSPEENKGVA